MIPLRFPELSTAHEARAVLALHLECAHGWFTPWEARYKPSPPAPCPTCEGLEAALWACEQTEAKGAEP